MRALARFTDTTPHLIEARIRICEPMPDKQRFLSLHVPQDPDPRRGRFFVLLFGIGVPYPACRDQGSRIKGEGTMRDGG